MKNLNVIEKKYDELCRRHNLRVEQNIRPSKQEVQNLLTVSRMLARAMTEMRNNLWSEYRRMNHQNEKMKRRGISFPLAEKRLEQIKGRLQAARNAMSEVGENLMLLLDKWQITRATYDDLLNFCNANYPGMRKRLEDFYSRNPDSKQDFSGLVFVHNLDYKDPHDKGWIENEIDAPLTHCMKELWSHKLMTDPKVSEGAHHALMKAFPDLMNNIRTLRTDEDGVQRLYDKDGECVGEVGEQNE